MAPKERSLSASLNGTSTSASIPLTLAVPSSEIAQRYGATANVQRSSGGRSVAASCARAPKAPADHRIVAAMAVATR